MARGDEEKRTLLRRLCQAQFFSSMPIEELRLYLLLLAAAEKIGRRKVIDLQSVRRAFPSGWGLADLKRFGLGLFKKGLAEIVIPPGRAPSRLIFTVFGLKEVKGDGKKRVESRRKRRQGPRRRR
ncbi:MAG: hypothetical protein ACK4Z6_01490 [Candidatus Methylomirabilales bacterium]